MSQQHLEFEDQSYEEPQPHQTYEEGYRERPAATYEPPRKAFVPQPRLRVGQVMPRQHVGGTGIGARVFLAIVSMLLVFGMFVAALAIGADAMRGSVFVLAVVFAFVFALVVLLINLIVNLVSLKR